MGLSMFHSARMRPNQQDFGDLITFGSGGAVARTFPDFESQGSCDDLLTYQF